MLNKVNHSPPESSINATSPKPVPGAGADLGGGCRGCTPPPPRDDLRFSNTTGIIGVEVEQETSAAPPKKNPGSAPA